MKNFIGVLKLKAWTIFSAASLVITAFLTSATGVTAYAQQQVCGNGGTGYCMNDWNSGGTNNVIKMYYGNSSNENFYAENLYKCNNNTQDTVTSTYYGDATDCPFANKQIDKDLAGLHIIQIIYGPKGLCVGFPQGANYYELTGCNDSNGNGGGYGTVQIAAYQAPWGHCNNSNQAFLVSREWSDLYGAETYVNSGGGIGNPLTLNNLSSTCWGGLSF